MSLQDALTDARETARDAILHGFDDRFAQLETRIAGRFQESRRQLAGRLNQAVRRLRRFDNAASWSQALVDSAGEFCGQARFFDIAGRNLADAPAFAHAVESGDPVVCMRTRGELSEEFSAYAERGGQVFVSTHSPDFLNHVKLENIFILAKENGFTSVRKASDDQNLVSLFREGDLPGALWRQKLFEGADPS